MLDFVLDVQRESAIALLDFVKQSLISENIDETVLAQKTDNLLLQQTLDFLIGLVARAVTDDLIVIIETSNIAYFQYRNLYPFGGNEIRAIKFSGKFYFIIKNVVVKWIIYTEK